MKKVFLSLFIGSMVFSLVLVSAASADTTLGTNLSTTGTLSTTGAFSVNKGSTTAVQFQDGSGTALFIFDTTNTRFGANSGGAVDTTLEVGGTASISGIITLGGNGTTGGQIRPGTNGVTAFRFQNAAGTTNVLMIDTTNTRVGVNAGGAVDTTFEVGGLASISYASISGNFELTGSSPLFGINAGAVINTAFEVGGVASVGTNLNVGETSTATTSVTFETRSATQGACFIITGSNNTVYYARVVASGSGGAWKISTTNCNP